MGLQVQIIVVQQEFCPDELRQPRVRRKEIHKWLCVWWIVEYMHWYAVDISTTICCDWIGKSVQYILNYDLR